MKQSSWAFVQLFGVCAIVGLSIIFWSRRQRKSNNELRSGSEKSDKVAGNNGEQCAHSRFTFERISPTSADGIDESIVTLAVCEVCNKQLGKQYTNISASWVDIYDHTWAAKHNVQAIEY